MALRGKQVRHLRALGNALRPVVTVGKGGVDEGLLGSLAAALEDHELVKVKLLESAGGERRALAAEIADRAGAELVQVLGRTVLLYRPRAENPEIVLPA